MSLNAGPRTALRHAAYVFAVAIALAYLEVQIEGAHGWATSLPTWRTTDPRVTSIFGGRPVTGYHVALNVLLLLLLHWPILFTRWSLLVEARVLSSYALLAVIWDFLWFVLNPNFGLELYSREHVWWFKRWFLGVPVDYYVGCLNALLLWLSPALFRRVRFRTPLLGGIVFVSVGPGFVGLFTLL